MANTPYESGTEEATQNAYSHLKEAGNNVREAARSARSDAQHRAQEQYSRGRDSAEAMALQAEERIREKPLAAIGVAFAAGWLISRLMR